MGMTDFPYWASWFTWFMFINTALTLIGWFIIVWNVISYSNVFLVWFYMWIYGFAIFGQIAFVQAFFEYSKYSGIVGSIIYFGCNLLVITVQSDSASAILKIIMSLFPQVAMNEISVVFGALEGNGSGL